MMSLSSLQNPALMPVYGNQGAGAGSMSLGPAPTAPAPGPVPQGQPGTLAGPPIPTPATPPQPVGRLDGPPLILPEDSGPAPVPLHTGSGGPAMPGLGAPGGNAGAPQDPVFPTAPGPVDMLPVGQGGGMGGAGGPAGAAGDLASSGAIGGLQGGMPDYMQNQFLIPPDLMAMRGGPQGPEGMQPLSPLPGAPDPRQLAQMMMRGR